MKPNYTKRNIVHLISSILQGLGSKSSYPQLSAGLTQEIKAARNVVLVVIDGLGYDQLKDSSGFLRKHLVGKLTSVFPPTTTAAITTFFTGLTPQEHGLTSWYMQMKEFGNQVVIILPYITKERDVLKETGTIAIPPSIFSRINKESCVVIPQIYLRSKYNSLLLAGAGIVPYRARKLGEWINATRRAMGCSAKKKFVYSYWPNYDDFCHYYGKESKPARLHLQEVDQALKKLANQLRGTNTLLLITADHGHCSTTRAKTIILKNHPRFLSYLTAIAGEARSVILHVKSDKKTEVEMYVKEKWKDCCTIHRSGDLLNKGYFGSGKIHPALKERIGDYFLLTKGNYAFREHPISKKHLFNVGHHAGLSKEEREVPLVKVKL